MMIVTLLLHISILSVIRTFASWISVARVCKRVVNGILDPKLYVHNELVNVQYVYGYCVNCGIKLRFEYGYLYCPENELPDSD